jgi:hypothetical protein
MMYETDLIAQLEREYDKRQLAEKALKWCGELCDSHFEHSHNRTDDTNSRFIAIKKIVTEYFNEKAKGKEQDNENRGIQSEHC